MNRRTFIHATGATSLGLGGLGFAEPSPPVTTLLKLLEDSPREQVPRELVRRIQAGASYADVLAALALAAVRNVQPYPDVGFKYHTVMMLRSIDSTTQHLPAADQWLPIIWAADYFKETQAEERAAGGWHQLSRPALPRGDADSARRSLIAALDRWDRDAADAAIVKYAQTASTDDIFSLLFPYGARDLRAIGHKAISVSNAHVLTLQLGTALAEPVLRSTVAALLNSDEDPNPATHDLPPDRPWRKNRERLGQIPPTWKQGHDDPGARAELRAALYQTSADDAGAIVVDLLRRGLSADAIWQVLFATAAELVLRRPGIVPVHAQTTANALHYAYLASCDNQTCRLMLLQCASFVAMFRQMTGATAADLDLSALQPLPLDRAGGDRDALGEVFSGLSSGQRLQAARKCLGYLQTGGDPEQVIALARHHVVYGAEEAHDYKFAEAVFDTGSRFADSPWRSRFLSAGMAYFKAPAHRPQAVVDQARELLSTR
jgi:hypothetical protein